jgi:hypothetical protein
MDLRRYEMRENGPAYGVWDRHLARFTEHAFGEDMMTEGDAEALLADLEAGGE